MPTQNFTRLPKYCPADIGTPVDEIETPALIVDLDAFERNIDAMARRAQSFGVRHRAHAKTHRSADIAKIQSTRGKACGVCCQKVSEAEALIAEGVADVLISNQVTQRTKIDRLMSLCGQARVIICVDDANNVDDLAAAAVSAQVNLECLVEINVGAGRCGVAPGEPARALAAQIADADGLTFSGIQAYFGAAQHIRAHSGRKAAISRATDMVRDTVNLLSAHGLDCAIVGGAGTGSYEFEATSGVYNELQCGSYIFMDADYQKNLDVNGAPVADFENALFVLTSVMSTSISGQAVCDAGHKAHSIDSGLPSVFGRRDLKVRGCSDEHTIIDDPSDELRLNDRLRLIPGHCDPTCNLHDWYIGIRNDRVETIWPVTARGLGY